MPHVRAILDETKSIVERQIDCEWETKVMTFNRASDAGWDRLYYPKMEGTASRKAGILLPKGTYEWSIGREGFFGPGTCMYHRHMPAEFVDFDGPLRPRAWDLDKHNSVTGSLPGQTTNHLSRLHPPRFLTVLAVRDRVGR